MCKGEAKFLPLNGFCTECVLGCVTNTRVPSGQRTPASSLDLKRDATHDAPCAGSHVHVVLCLAHIHVCSAAIDVCRLLSPVEAHAEKCQGCVTLARCVFGRCSPCVLYRDLKALVTQSILTLSDATHDASGEQQSTKAREQRAVARRCAQQVLEKCGPDVMTSLVYFRPSSRLPLKALRRRLMPRKATSLSRRTKPRQRLLKLRGL